MNGAHTHTQSVEDLNIPWFNKKSRPVVRSGLTGLYTHCAGADNGFYAFPGVDGQ